ncbi:MAG TPA: hypothetical protein VGB85_28710 [Nannocystis sp.]
MTREQWFFHLMVKVRALDGCGYTPPRRYENYRRALINFLKMHPPP